jgi:hypothetical protein
MRRNHRLLFAALTTVVFAGACSAPATGDEPGTAESNLDTTKAVPVTVGGAPVSVPLDANGAYRPLRFEAPAGSRVVVSVRPASGDVRPKLKLHRADGAELASGDGVVRVTLANDGAHYVAIAGPGTTPLTVAVAAFLPLADALDLGTTWEFPSSGSESLRALHPRGEAEIWTAGGDAVVRWDGVKATRWRLGEDSRLTTIWAAAADDVWAGGRRLWHFDGTTWSEVLRPKSVSTGTVAGSSAVDVWTHGYDEDTNKQLLLRWDGERFRDAGEGLWRPGSVLAVRSASDAWLFGLVENHPNQWNGTSWTSVGPAEKVYSPRQPARDAVLFPDGSLAVLFADTRDGSVRIRDAAGAWTGIASFTGRWPLGLRYEGADAQSLWGATSSKIWVTERNGTDVFRRVQNEQEKWEAGSAWRNVRSAVRDAFVRGTPGGMAWFAGAQGQIGRQDGDDAVIAVTEPGPECRDMSRAPTGEVWAACEGTLRKRSASGAWSVVEVPGASRGAPITAVWAETASRVWFATGSGKLAKLEGGAVTELGTFRSSSFRAVSGSSASDVWFVAPQGLVHWDGTAARPLDLGRPDLGRALVLGPQAAFVAAGDQVMSFDGTIWTTSSSLGRTIEHLAASSASDVWAASSEALARWDGASWSAQAWKTDLPPACAKDRITALAAPTSGAGVIVATSSGCLGALGTSAARWVKRPVPVDRIVALGPDTVLGAASSGGAVRIVTKEAP